jgi:hypothetical protein
MGRAVSGTENNTVTLRDEVLDRVAKIGKGGIEPHGSFFDLREIEFSVHEVGRHIGRAQRVDHRDIASIHRCDQTANDRLIFFKRVRHGLSFVVPPSVYSTSNSRETDGRDSTRNVKMQSTVP